MTKFLVFERIWRMFNLIKLMKVYKTVFLFCAVFFAVSGLSSCSLDYETEEEGQNTIVPEMILNNVDFLRIDRGVKVLTLNADSLELFNQDDTTFGKDARFWLFGRNGECTSFGRCDLLNAENATGVYMLLGNVQLENYQNNYSIKAQNLRWNSSTEQLVSDRENTVEVWQHAKTTDDSSLYTKGTGFCFSAFRLGYRFENEVTGSVSASR